ncbi:MAG: DUF4844 domain-containing protein [Bacteroidota bacterium]
MNEIVEELDRFLRKDKFTVAEWENRGLNPSSPELCSKMTNLLNECCEKLIQHAQENSPTKVLRKELRAGLNSFQKSEYDTEEKEFIGDYFLELSNITLVDFKDDLNKWLYGSFMNGLLKITSALKGPTKIVETLSQDCTNCGAKLETFITKKQEGIPDYAFDIIRCNSCGEYNMLDKGPDIHSLHVGEYELVEQLPKAEFSKEQAKTRLEQLRHWMK